MGKRRDSNSGGGGGESWMNTYADMVTLLLCFFVLLYSISTIDTAKWQIIVKSFNPDAKNVSQLVDQEQVEEGNDPLDSNGSGLPTTEKDLDNLYWTMKKYVEENDLEESIEVSKGEDFTFIVFRNNVFFDGDSSVLRPEGKEILDFLSGAVKEVNTSIGEMRILGHTTQARVNTPNIIEGDRFISSDRATTVLVYIQHKDIINPKKLVSLAYGQHYPIAPFDTEENRAKNRRVEILFTKNDTVNLTLDKVYEEIGTNIIE